MGRRACGTDQGLEGNLRTPIDHAIAEYRSELEAEADLAREDLVELEDHLRTLIDDLRATGASSEQAIAQARLRLGDPKLLAREHARVRSPFGAKLSRARAWSAGGLFLGMVGLGWWLYGRPFSSWFAIQLVLGACLSIGVIARLAWARAAMFGYVAYNLVHVGIAAIVFEYRLFPEEGLLVAMEAAVLAFVMPWRRGEIGPAGYALALVCLMFDGSILANWLTHTYLDAPHVAMLAHAATIATGIAIVMRGRWAASMGLVTAACLAISAFQLAGYDGPLAEIVVPTIAVGALAGVACAAISWRTARTTLGSLRGFLAA